MYEKLLIGLRGHAKRYGCDDRCPCYDAEDRGYTTCSEELAEKAADAIEELSKRVEESIPKTDAEIIIAELSKPRWIPVTERLPREELCFYLCYTDEGVIVECLWTNNKYGLGPFGEWGWRLMDVPQHQRITHWMPLPPAPEPPKEEE